MKKFLSLFFAMLLSMSVTVAAFASPGHCEYVYDYADILSEDEEGKLDQKLSQLADADGVPLVVVTKSNNANYSANEYAQNFYKNNSGIFDDYGEPCGLISVLDFDNSTHLFYTVGDGDKIFDDDTTDTMYNSLVTYYKNSDYYNMYDNMVKETGNVLNTYFNKNKASGYSETYDYSAPKSDGAFIVDSAGLLKDEQKAELIKKIEAIHEKYNFQIVLHTTKSIGNKKISDYADDFYDYNGYAKDGLLFMLNMNEGKSTGKEYYTSTSGFGETAFTDYAIKDSDSRINSKVSSLLKDGKYYEAFDKYLDLADIFLAQAKNGKPYDTNHPYVTAGEYVLMEMAVVIVAAIIAYFAVKKMKKKMNNAVLKKEAADYMVDGSMNVMNGFARYVRSDISRVKRAQSNNSSSGGSHESSSGDSHGGGGGNF